MFPKRCVYQDDMPLSHFISKKDDQMQEIPALYLNDISSTDLPSFRTAVMNSIMSKHPLRHRMNALLHFSPYFFWRSNHHFIRFDAFSRRHPVAASADNASYRAAVYLITANVDLYRRTRGCFGPTGIDFEKADTSNIGPQNYLLLSAASDLYSGTQRIEVADLANRNTVGDESFRLIVNALMICLYGVEITKETRQEMQYDY